MTHRDVSIAIPTYRREGVLVSTIESLLTQGPIKELLVIDQTAQHEPGVESTLSRLHAAGQIRWLRLQRPSITRAMNLALHEAEGPIVLFLDDDIVPAPGLIDGHSRAYSGAEVWAVGGQVLQPGQQPTDVPYADVDGFYASLEFPFNSTRRTHVRSVMAGNLSVRRDQALRIGGFDESFLGVAYRFETDFCRRVYGAGGVVVFEPSASIRHLKFPHGGTRSHGSHLTSPSPAHGVGDYYFALKHGLSLSALAYVLRRPFREVCTRFHLRHPWWIPVKWIGEMGALLWAVGLALRGPRYAEMPSP